MTDKHVKWTEQQKQAIGARGGNVFVTATSAALTGPRFVTNSV